MINVLDIETFESNNKVIPFCLCMVVDNRVHSIYDSENIIIDAINIIVTTSNDVCIEIYIHNLNFDGILIIEQLSIHFIKFEIVAEKTNIYQLKIHYYGKIIIFKCSYKIIPVSLKQLGISESFNKTVFPYKFINKETLTYIGVLPCEKYWENGDFNEYILNKKIIKHDEYIFNVKLESIEYCINDVLLTQRVLLNLFIIIDKYSASIRKKAMSAPSIAHKLFFKKYNIMKILENLNMDEDEYIRNSYFGGRCEVYGNLKNGEHIKYFDFSGMYAQCMLEKFHNGVGEFVLCERINKPGFYNITYESNFDFLPILPSRGNNGKLLFVNGLKTGTFWFEEIILFEQNGGKLVKINNAIIYNDFNNVFKNFVDTFSELRKFGGYYKIFGKLMINSLYGGMALKNKDSLSYITFSEKEFNNILENANVEIFYKVNSCFIIILINDYKTSHFFKNKNLFKRARSKRNVSYASAIAAKARVKLFTAMTNVIRDGGRLLYCDTDSIFAAYPISDKRKSFYELEWLEFFSDGFFASPKTYGIRAEHSIIKIKGISKKNVNYDNLKEDFFLSRDLVFKDQLNFRKYDFNMKQFYSEKKICLSTYDKRIFINNKTETLPIAE